MQKEIQQSIKKIRTTLKRTTDENKKFQLRDELKKLKKILQKEKLVS